MCGRYVVSSSIGVLEKKFNTVADFSSFKPNYNLAPGDFGPVITSEDPIKLQLFRFGYTPSWNESMFVINARGENLLTKRMWKAPYTLRRCLVFANAFMEGSEKEKLSKPYLVYMRDKKPFCMAGLYSMGIDKITGAEFGNFAIITTAPNKLHKRIGHHRSPVILDKGAAEQWINERTRLADLTPWIRPYESMKMNAHPITPKIRSPKPVPIDYLKPIGDRVFHEFEEGYYRTELLRSGRTSSSQRRMMGEDADLSARRDLRQELLTRLDEEIESQTDYPNENKVF